MFESLQLFVANFIDNLSQFHFLRPAWLLAIPLAAILFSWCHRRQQALGSWAKVINPRWLPYLLEGEQEARQRHHTSLWILGALLTGLGLAGPTWQQLPQPVHQDQTPLVIAVDLSPSMLVADLKPNRISRARLKLIDLLKSRREGQTALLVYGESPYMVSPLTDDTKTIMSQVPVLSPQLLPGAGSNTEAAIDMALQLLHDAGNSQGDILLITDGIADSAAKYIHDNLDNNPVQLSILGVGTEQGAPIPLPQGGFAKDRGAIVVAKLDREQLVNLAHRNSGHYTDLTADDNDINYLNSGFLSAGLSNPLNHQSKELERHFDNWSDQGHLFALLLLPLIIFAFRKGLIAAVLLLPLATPQQANASLWQDLWQTKNQQGFEKFQQQQFEDASAAFDNKNWKASSAYRNKNFDAALEQFKHDNSADGLYNQGNALAQLGKLDEAISAYNDALTQQPDHADAAANKALLEQLKNQQQEQQQNQDSSDSEDSESDDSNKDNSEQKQSDQNASDQDKQNQDQQQSEQNDSNQDQSQQNESDSDSEQQQSEADTENSQSEQEQENPQQTEGEEPQNEQPQPPSDEERSAEQQQKMEQTAASEAEQEEADQAMEQFLRKVPDDPGAFLRRKFEHKTQRRERTNYPNQQEQRW